MNVTIFPPGTVIHAPTEAGAVVIQFPSEDDAIVFHEFLRGFAAGQYSLEAVERDEDASLGSGG